MTKIVSLKERRRRSGRGPLVALAKSTGAGRFFDRMVREIETDLGGRRELSRIERELISAFAGSATAVQYLTAQITLGESAELDLGNFATLASTMLRIGSRLGFHRRSRDVLDLPTYLASLKEASPPEEQHHDADVDEAPT